MAKKSGNSSTAVLEAKTAVQEVVAYAQKIAKGEHESVRPGDPYTFSEASVPGDMVWQGDLGIGLVSESPPDGYVKKDRPLKCLVPGKDETIGSKHCLESLEGVEMWLPKEWDEASLNGPYLRLTNGAKITHPVHGDVTIPACFNSVQIVYQREWDQEQARERRARD